MPNQVNEIILKIEMKKFQNLLDNRQKNQNSLLQVNLNRMYPMNKALAEYVNVNSATEDLKSNKTTHRSSSNVHQRYMTGSSSNGR